MGIFFPPGYDVDMKKHLPVLISGQIHFLPWRELDSPEADTVAVVELAAVGVVQLQHIRDADGSAVVAGNRVAEECVDLLRVIGPDQTVIDCFVVLPAGCRTLSSRASYGMKLTY